MNELSQSGVDFNSLIKSELNETDPPTSGGAGTRFRGSNEIAEDGNRVTSKTNSEINMHSFGIRERSQFVGKSRQLN